VVCKDDVVKYILSGPILKGRLGKWMMALAEFDLRYELEKGVKGQILVDLLVEHTGSTTLVGQVSWTLDFDGLMSREWHWLLPRGGGGKFLTCLDCGPRY
jgi:hypothetical protein